LIGVGRKDDGGGAGFGDGEAVALVDKQLRRVGDHAAGREDLVQFG